LDSLIAKTPC